MKRYTLEIREYLNGKGFKDNILMDFQAPNNLYAQKVVDKKREQNKYSVLYRHEANGRKIGMTKVVRTGR